MDKLERNKYDALSLLIREDNKAFEKTWLYSYDNNGNILKQRVFTFTMKEEEDEIHPLLLWFRV